MTYEEIFEVVKRNMVDVLDDIDISKVEPQKSMKDYGADSLEMVEIVSRTVKELRIKAPRTEITAAKNLDGFIQVLLAHSDKQSS